MCMLVLKRCQCSSDLARYELRRGNMDLDLLHFISFISLIIVPSSAGTSKGILLLRLYIVG